MLPFFEHLKTPHLRMPKRKVLVQEGSGSLCQDKPWRHGGTGLRALPLTVPLCLFVCRRNALLHWMLPTHG